MNIRTDNSLYKSEPPKASPSNPEIENPFDLWLENALDMYNFERNQDLFFDKKERAELCELIKNGETKI